MKQMAAVKRIGALCGALVLAAGLILSGCEQPSGGGGGGGSEPPVVKKGLSFSKSQATVYAGGKVRLSLSVEGDISYDDIAVETDGWDASYQSGIVTVTAPAGAKKGDSVTVTADYLLDKAVKSSCTVTVIERPEGYRPVENITISGTLKGMKIGDSKKLTAVVTPPNATSKDALFWGSSDPAVATVSQDGTVTVVGYGEAEIFAAADLAESNKIPVSVKIDIETLTLEKTKWRSDTLAEGENNTYYTIWFTSNTDAVVQGVTVYPKGDTESLVIGSSYDISKTDEKITVYNWGDLSIKDSFLQAWGPEFRLVPYTEPPKIITLDLAKTKWTGDNVTVWFIDDTQFVWNREGEIITGDFTQKDGMITLGSQGFVFILSETQFRDGEGHKYTKTEWTPPSEKSALARTKWAVKDTTIWFINDTVCCYSWSYKDEYSVLYSSYMYGSYSTRGDEVTFFGGLFTGSVDGDALKAESLGESAFQKDEYTPPEHDFSGTAEQILGTTWRCGNSWIEFSTDYTCSYDINNSSGSGKAIVFGYSDEYGIESVSWVESEGMFGIDMTLNKTDDNTITSLTSNDGSVFKQ